MCSSDLLALKFAWKEKGDYFMSCEDFLLLRVYLKLREDVEKEDSLRILISFKKFMNDSFCLIGKTGYAVFDGCIVMTENKLKFSLGKTFFKKDSFTFMKKWGCCVNVKRRSGF